MAGDPASGIVAPAGATPADIPADAAGTLCVGGGSILERADLNPRRNPYFLALWIVGVGFVVLGIVLYLASVFSSYTSSPARSSDVTGLVFSQLGWMFAGPLITVGLATLVTLVMLTGLVSHRAKEAHASTAGEDGAAGRSAGK